MRSLYRQRGFFDGFSALAGLAGSLISGSMAQEGAENLNQANIDAMNARNTMSAEEAEKNRQFQTYMSNTAFRRAVGDLKSADLNPMLAIGHSATTPPGAQAEFGVPALHNAPAIGVSSATAAAKVGAEIDLLLAQSDKVRSETILNAEHVPRIRQEVRTSAASAGHLDAETRRIDNYLSEMFPIEQQHLITDTRLKLRQGNLTLEQAETEAVRRKELVERVGLTEAERILAQEHQKESRARGRLLHAESELTELHRPRAANEAEAQKSWWMRNVSPYLPDVLKGSWSGRSIRDTFRTPPAYTTFPRGAIRR